MAPNQPNKVEIGWTNPDPTKQFCVGVYVFKKVSVASLIENLKKNHINDPEMTRKMVREKLQISDSDFAIETDTLKVSLQCPLMKTRMQLPGRSFKCKHVQCFEIESYLMMNEKKPTWNCPVCDQNAPYDDLIIDGLNQEILTKCTDADEIEFASDGTWTRVNENEKQPVAKKKHEDTKKTVNNDDDDICVEICDLSMSPPPPVKRNNSTNEMTTTLASILSNANAAAQKKDDDIIDLTCESDEEMQEIQSVSKAAAAANSHNKSIALPISKMSRSSSNSSSIYNQQVSNEAQANSSDSNNDEINCQPRNNCKPSNNNNNTPNKLNNKEIRFEMFNFLRLNKRKCLVEDDDDDDDCNSDDKEDDVDDVYDVDDDLNQNISCIIID